MESPCYFFWKIVGRGDPSPAPGSFAGPDGHTNKTGADDKNPGKRGITILHFRTFGRKRTILVIKGFFSFSRDAYSR